MRIDAPIYFANTQYIRDRLRSFSERYKGWCKDKGERMAGSGGCFGGGGVQVVMHKRASQFHKPNKCHSCFYNRGLDACLV